MRILVALTYYRPHISGLTTYAQRLAEGLAAKGHQVTVLTSHYDHDLPFEEHRNGVAVVRAGVLARFGKGVLMPGYARRARTLVAASDVILVNYPITPPESNALVRAARQSSVAVVTAYQCDLELPASAWRPAVERAVAVARRRLLDEAASILVLSMDYARTSRMLQQHLAKCVQQAPPAVLRPAAARDVAAFRSRHAPGATVVVGVAARIAAEKGIEYLLAAKAPLDRVLGRVQLIMTGDPCPALGEERYWNRVAPLLATWADQAAFVGPLQDRDMAAFFAACDVTCLPSVNRTESFGLVQVESMLCGTPVVATDLPGIRDPIVRSGMGQLVPPRDTASLAAAIAEVVRERAGLVRSREQISAIFGTAGFVDDCERELRRVARTDQTAPLPPPEDDLARAARLHTWSVPPFRALVRAAESALIRRHVPTGGPVLDLGCGDGQFAAVTLATPVAFGLDLDRAATDRARRSGVFERVLCESADRIPLPDGCCALVLANSVLEHIPDLAGPLAEARRVLVPDGRLVITAPSHRFAEGIGVAVGLERLGLARLARRYRNWFNRVSRHHHLDSADVWRARLDTAGFRVVHHEYYLSRSAMFWFDLLHYASVPSLLTRTWLGRWHWLGRPLLRTARAAVITRLARRVPDNEGACVFLLALKK